MKSLFKKTLTVAAAVSLVCLSSIGAMATDKLIVKDSGGSNNKFTVTDSGFIGIGTNISPNTALQVVGTSLNSARLKVSFSGTTLTDSGSLLFLRQDATGTNSMPKANEKLGSITFGAMDGTTTRIGSTINSYASSNWGTSSTPTYLTFSTVKNGTTTLTEQMRITSYGNVGIGLNPTQKLEVNGAIRLNTTGGRPACSSSIRGTIWFVQGATTVADTLAVCAKNSSDAYGWRDLF